MGFEQAMMEAVYAWWQTWRRYPAARPFQPEYVRVLLAYLRERGHWFNMTTGEWT